MKYLCVWVLVLITVCYTVSCCTISCQYRNCGVTCNQGCSDYCECLASGYASCWCSCPPGVGNMTRLDVALEELVHAYLDSRTYDF